MGDLSSRKIGMVSLGCPKALVDSEVILTRLRAEGYETSPTYQGSDAVIVNTCAFLDSAREESLAAIAEAEASGKPVIVTGCLGAERALVEARAPGVAAITGPHAADAVMEAVHRVAPRSDPFAELVPVPAGGVKLTPKHYAYLKISEGCNHRCSFCIIPALRGDLVSRPIGEVLAEAEALASTGVKELLVVSQDTSAYGLDIRYAQSEWRGRDWTANLEGLCRGLGELGLWTRLHYVYPYPHVDQVIPLMAEGKILPYLDIPFQHAAPNVLKAMKRPAAQEKTLERIARWREIAPDLTIRSTFVVGFPGETEADVDELCAFIREARFERLGVFRYSQEEGTRAAKMEEQLPKKTKEARWHRVMKLQKEIAADVSREFVGRTLKVLVEEPGVARGEADAPDIDGRVYLPLTVPVGDFVNVEITGYEDYDLLALPAGAEPTVRKVARQAQ